MAQHGAQQVTPRDITLLGETGRVPWRLGPVLTLLVVAVRRCAHRDVRREHMGEVLGIRAAGVHADSQVGHDADRHAGIHRALLGGGQLLIAQPLQPHVEGGQFIAVGFGAVRGGQLGDLPLGTPGREINQSLTLLLHEVAEGPVAFGGALDAEDLVQDLQLRLEDGVALDDVGGEVLLAELVGKLGDLIPQIDRELVELGHILHAEVDRVDEPAGGGQVRGILGGWQGFRGVQRVDEEEIGAVDGQHTGEMAQIVEITHTPRQVGTHGVDLRHDTGAGGFQVLVRGGQTLRGDDQPAGGGLFPGGQPQLVPAERQVGRKLEARLAPGGAVHLARRRPVVHLVCFSTLARFKLNVHLCGRTLVHMDGEDHLITLHRHHTRRQGTGELPVVESFDGGVDGPIRRLPLTQIHVKGAENLDQRVITDRNVGALVIRV